MHMYWIRLKVPLGNKYYKFWMQIVYCSMEGNVNFFLIKTNMSFWVRTFIPVILAIGVLWMIFICDKK